MTNFPTNIKDYVRVYHDVFSKEFCESAIASLKTSSWDTHQFYNTSGDYIHVGDDFLQTRTNTEEKEHIDKMLWKVTQQYILIDFASFYEKFQWFGRWSGVSPVKFHKYDTGTNMKLHCDHIHDIFDGDRKGVPILSIVGLLNENFEGGDFLLWEKEKIELKAGSVLVFPSNFMYPHEVTQITSGSRYSFVSWVW